MIKRLCIVIVLFLSFPYIGGASEKRYNVPIGNSPSWGPENAPITIVEFIDYQ